MSCVRSLSFRGTGRGVGVFFFADDQTTSTLGCYGNEVIQTPNIDSLASRGTRFSNSFVSHSICWVSRTTILSGLTGRSYGTHGRQDVARPEQHSRPEKATTARLKVMQMRDVEHKRTEECERQHHLQPDA